METVQKVEKILVKDLVKVYLERRALARYSTQCKQGEECLVLDRITFSVKPREFTCIVGPSGCGKSTMLRILAGFEEATAGTVLIDGSEVNGPSSKHIFVFQEDGLFPWMTAKENIALGILNSDDDKQSKEEKVNEYLDMVGLAEFGNHYPHQLSGGMRRRAEVARALISEPDILFMDEPFGALDFVTRLQMREEMLNVHAMFDTTILFITHDIDEALQLGDKVIVLGDRPAKIKADLDLDYPHPRDLSAGALKEMRKEIYFLLGLHAAL